MLTAVESLLSVTDINDDIKRAMMCLCSCGIGKFNSAVV